MVRLLRGGRGKPSSPGSRDTTARQQPAEGDRAQRPVPLRQREEVQEVLPALTAGRPRQARRRQAFRGNGARRRGGGWGGVGGMAGGLFSPRPRYAPQIG